MGNCLHHESAVQWGGDDWGSPVPDQFFATNTRGEKQENMLNIEEKLLHERERGLASSTESSTEVKIKITKKQLEELLGRVEMKQLSVKQVLVELMNVSDRYKSHQRSWRPNLQSIPE